MNTRNHISFIQLLLLLVIFIATVTSCKKEQELRTLTQQINLQQTALRHDDFIKDSEGDVDDLGDEPNENPKDTTPLADNDTSLIGEITRWGDNTIGSPIETDLEGYVGVLNEVDNECDNYYTELTIVFDTEHDNDQTNMTGWRGKSGGPYFLADEDHFGYQLSFCLVPANNFTRNRYDYALLRLTYDYPYSVSLFCLYEDCEDKNNWNYVYETNGGAITPIYDRYSSYPPTYYPIGATVPTLYFGRNIGLNFLYYTSTQFGSTSFPTLPYIGQEYGVFGRIGPSQGMIFLDDEDYKNVNTRGVYLFNDLTGLYPASGQFNYNINQIANVIYQDVNTYYYLSKAF
jgi:hypothetical protein